MGCVNSTRDVLLDNRTDQKPHSDAHGIENHLKEPTPFPADTSPNTNSNLDNIDTDNIRIDTGMFVTQQQHHLADRYTREKKLGDGAYGEVLLCRDKVTGNKRAVKIIKKGSGQDNDAIMNEVEVVKSLDHPNVMKIYEFFQDRRNFYLVMECYTGGELFDEIIRRTKFTENDAAAVMEQCLLGLTYLHSKNIVHRDLKPENLLLESKAKNALIKIVDFGLSTVQDPDVKLNNRFGTAYYIAPEVIRKKYDEKCDVWSLGVIMYILLCGYPPFGGETDAEILKKVEAGRYDFDPCDWSGISSDAKDIIRKMLMYNSVKRISASDCLKHNWILKKSTIGQLNGGNALAQGALNNMKKFHSNQKLAQAALLFMGSKLTTMDETRELTTIFRQLDKDGNGRLDRQELIDGYKLLWSHKVDGGGNAMMTPAEVEREVDGILKSIDMDRNGYIEFGEFVTACMNKAQLVTKERLKAAFNMFDQDGSGAIAAEELRGLLGDIDDATWSTILAEVDENGDGEVDFEEFESMMLKLVHRSH